jgi:hypothetical protein
LTKVHYNILFDSFRYGTVPINFWWLWNLSLAELTYCFFIITKRICMIAELPIAVFYLEVIANAGIFIYIITCMYIITIDRFLIAHYNIRYVKCWTRQRASFVIVFQFLLCLLYTIVLMVWHNEDFNQLREYLAIYYWVIADYTYLVIALFTYLYIINIYAHNRARTTSIRPSMITTTSGSSPANVFKTAEEEDLDEFRRRKFMYSVFITSFIACVIVPDQTYFIMHVLHGGVSFELDVALMSLFCVGLVADAVNYVWCLKRLRCIWISMLPRQLRCCKMMDSSESNDREGTCV